MTEKEPYKAKSSEDKKRSDWEANHEAIKEVFVAFIKEHQKKPTITYIANKLEMQWNTIWRHLADLENELRKHPLRVLTDDMILAVVEAGKNGNAQSQKLWFQLMEGWSEKTNLEIRTDGIALPRKLDLSKLTTEDLEEYQRIQSIITGEKLGD